MQTGLERNMCTHQRVAARLIMGPCKMRWVCAQPARAAVQRARQRGQHGGGADLDEDCEKSRLAYTLQACTCKLSWGGAQPAWAAVEQGAHGGALA